MQFQYSTTSAAQNEFDSLPRLPLFLSRREQRVEAVGLVDSEATVNVLPYEIGDFAPTELVFAWVRSPNAPLIFGQTNFFLEIDVCFYRS